MEAELNEPKRRFVFLEEGEKGRCYMYDIPWEYQSAGEDGMARVTFIFNPDEPHGPIAIEGLKMVKVDSVCVWAP